MKQKIISTEDYEKALKRLEKVFDAPIGTPESNEADALAELIDEYENKHFPIDEPENGFSK